MALGGMRMPALSVKDAAQMIETACQLDIFFFDNATCYTEGQAESRFGEALRETGIARESLYIQSKVGLEFSRNEFD